MKKPFVIILALLLVLSLFACAKKEPFVQESTPSSSEAPSQETGVVRVTFREGLTLVGIAEKLEENGVCSAKDFVAASQDVDRFRDSLGYGFLDDLDETDAAFTLEGYLFPDTYDFYKGEDPYSAVSRFLKNFNAKFSSGMYDELQELGMSLRELVSLASIIQSECGFVSEMKNVSSVFHNRLNSSAYGKLQSDVTINYVNKYINDSPYLDDTDGFADLYNTYKREGLPVGAVCCPGLDALLAALEPAQTPYYFFVTDSENNYYYAETYQEHIENCTECGIY